MSRLGKKPIRIPEGVEAKVENGKVWVKGPKGEVEYQLPAIVSAELNEDILKLTSVVRRKEQRITYGLARATIANMVKGVSKGFKKTLELTGVGYTVSMEGEDLKVNLGYSHPMIIKKPEDLEIEVKKNTITVKGIDKEKVGKIAAEIRSLRKVEPYKGKGLRYIDEVVRRKVGKAALKTEGEGGEK
jgi:large subunit ribosomal protein L6